MASVGVVSLQLGKLHGQTPVQGTITQNWNTAEATVCIIGAAGTRYKVQSAITDISALVGNITFRMYITVNGVLRQIFPPVLASTVISGTNCAGIALINGTFGIANALQITAQSDNIADNGKAIGFEYFLEAM